MNRRVPLVALGVALLLAIPATAALQDLAAARQARDTARTEATSSPGPVAAAGAAFPAGDIADARIRLTARIRADAAQGGVLVETITPDDRAPPALAVLTLRASGSEKAVLAFADGLERGGQPVRMAAWRLTAAPGGVRLDARLVAPWRG